MMRSHDGPPRDGDPSGLDAELRAAADALRRLPAVRPGATARVLAAARGEARPAPLSHRRWPAALTAMAAALLVVAAGIRLAGRAVVRGDGGAAAPSAPVALGGDTPRVSPASVPLYTVASASDAADDAPVPVPFVLRLPRAARVAVIGDFNGWNPAATPLAATANGVWTATVALTPGRHAYGFVVDDTIWVRDPRAELEHDVDYGRDHSVIVVGRP